MSKTRHSAIKTKKDIIKIWDTFLGEISQEAGKLCKAGNELAVVTGQPQEPPHLFFGFGTWAGCNGCSFIHLWTHLPTYQVVPQILYLHPHISLVWPWATRTSGTPGLRPPAAPNKRNGHVTNCYKPYGEEKALC